MESAFRGDGGRKVKQEKNKEVEESHGGNSRFERKKIKPRA